MPDGIPFIDILIFAVIAIFLGLRLHSVLGKRTGFEQKKTIEHRIIEGHRAAEEATRKSRKKSADGKEAGESDSPPEKPATPLSGKGIPAIKKADPDFNEAHFIKGAKAAYRAILSAFAAGNLTNLKPLLGYELQGSFSDAIRKREAEGEVLTITLDSLESAKIAAAELREGLAVITVAFRSRQKRVLRARDGNILEGDEKEAEDFGDLWTFERDIASRDPNWLLVETQTGES